MASGKLKQVQELRKERAAIQERVEANKEERQAAARARLKSIGVEEGDDHDTIYRKMKQAIDREISITSPLGLPLAEKAGETIGWKMTRGLGSSLSYRMKYIYIYIYIYNRCCHSFAQLDSYIICMYTSS